MQTIEFPTHTASRPSYCTRPADNPVSRKADDQIESGFLATLLAMAGHDLRQPLQLITSAHDVLATMLRDKEQREELARAGDATGQLAGMLSQLIDALQLQERPRENLRAPVLLWPVLDDLVAEFGDPARRKGIAFRVTTARGTASSHPVLLTSILRNLVRNAIDYTPRGGRVFVASHRRGPELRIEVRDTGAGIRRSALATIFEAFQRADETRADGLGLGLFIVKRATDLLGHRVEVQSVEGRGSRFTVVARAASYETSQQPDLECKRLGPSTRHAAFHFCDGRPGPRAGRPHNGGVSPMTDFSRLLETEILRLRRYARALTRDAVYSDDLVQNCLTGALAKQHLWQPGTDLRAWLFTVLHHQYCNEVRRSVREGSSVELDQAPPVPVLSNALAVLELRDLERAINRLPEDQRTVVLLIGLEGMQYDRVAAILNVPVGTVRSRLGRARAKLRRLMDPDRPVRPQPAFAPGLGSVTVRQRAA